MKIVAEENSSLSSSWAEAAALRPRWLRPLWYSAGGSQLSELVV